MTVTKQPTGQDLVCLVCRTDKDIDMHVQWWPVHVCQSYRCPWSLRGYGTYLVVSGLWFALGVFAGVVL